MCTAIKHKNFVGRNLDVYKVYGEEVIITPRGYAFSFRKEENIINHYAIIGIGAVSRGYPLYFDAANEAGLYMAGLNYVGNAYYSPSISGMVNLAPFELMPYILSKCKNTEEAEKELSKIHLTDIPFSRELPSSELHWIVADKERALTVEPDKNGINIYDNPTGVLSNNPSFPLQLFNLNDFLGLDVCAPKNTFSPELKLSLYSEGMGAIGLPGDLSSKARFARAVFHKSHARGDDGLSSIFHLLSSVEMPDGSVRVGDSYERTEYTSAVNLATMTYYYRTYESASISAVRLFKEDIDTPSLITFPMSKYDPVYQN